MPLVLMVYDDIMTTYDNDVFIGQDPKFSDDENEFWTCAEISSWGRL